MKQTLILLCILCWRIGFGQILSPEVLTSSGDYFTNTTNSLSWTIGECVTETFSNVNNKLTQGFQQNKFMIITSFEENTKGTLSLFVYPNPASAFINIIAESAELRKMKAEIFDITGKLIHSETFQNNVQLNISDYSNSTYILHIYDDNKLMKTFKLEKTN